MLLVKTANGQVEQFPYTLGDLRRDNPKTSFPKKIGDAILASHSIYHVTPDKCYAWVMAQDDINGSEAV
jgi:hypothetical protein